MGAAALFGYRVRFQHGIVKHFDVPLNGCSDHTVGAAPDNGDADTEECVDEQIRVSNVFPWLLKSGKVPRREIQNLSDLYVLGTGSTGTVRLSHWPFMGRNLLVAIKSVRKEHIRRYHEAEHIQNERKALAALRDSPFIVRLLNTFQDSAAVHLLLEYVPGGGLHRRLSRAERLSSEEAKFYAAEIFLAIEHMHALGMVYRDLCIDHVMIDEGGHVKLVDFGSARWLEEDGRCSSYIGNPAYMAPERLLRSMRYDATSDWWSFGCLLFELVAGVTPFRRLASDTPNDIYNRIMRHDIAFPESAPPVLSSLISQLLTVPLDSRLATAQAIRNCSFFSFRGCSWRDFEVRKVVPPFLPQIRPGGAPYFTDASSADLHPRLNYVFPPADVEDLFVGF